jgi:hypothetical protein
MSRFSPSLSQDIPLIEIRIHQTFVLVFQVRGGVVLGKTGRNKRRRRRCSRREWKVIG